MSQQAPSDAEPQFQCNPGMDRDSSISSISHGAASDEGQVLDSPKRAKPAPECSTPSKAAAEKYKTPDTSGESLSRRPLLRASFSYSGVLYRPSIVTPSSSGHSLAGGGPSPVHVLAASPVTPAPTGTPRDVPRFRPAPFSASGEPRAVYDLYTSPFSRRSVASSGSSGTRKASPSARGSSGAHAPSSRSSGSSRPRRGLKRATSMVQESGSGAKVARRGARWLLHRSASSTLLSEGEEDLSRYPSGGSELEETTSSIAEGRESPDGLNRSRSTGSVGQRLLPDGSCRACVLPIVRFGQFGQFYSSAHALAPLLEARRLGRLELHVIDCRYPYEFSGGHVRGAVNLPSVAEALEYMRQLRAKRRPRGRTQIFVFYCEFSSVRGPHTYRQVRCWDRDENNARYPALFFPEMYLINGGYKKFFECYPALCEPRGYVTMRSNQDESRRWLQLSRPSRQRQIDRERLRGARANLFEENPVDRNLAAEFNLQL